MTTSSTAVSPSGRNDVISFPDKKPIPRQKIDPRWTPDQLFGVRQHLVHAMFGKKHWASEWVLDLCEADPRFLPHLADQPPDYVHFICLVTLALSKQHPIEADSKHAAMLCTQSRKKILQALWPSCPDGILGVLPRLPKEPLAEEDYRLLVRGLENKSLCKLLYHSNKLRRLDLELLEIIEYFPEAFQSAEIMKLIKDTDDCSDILFLSKLAECCKMEITQREVSRIAHDMSEVCQLYHWFFRKTITESFPPPPWPGNERLKPVCTRDELRAAAKAFRNCVEIYAWELFMGRRCFYVYADLKIIIEVVNDAVLGWGIGRMETVKSREISLTHMREVLQAFSDSDFYMRPSGKMSKWFDFDLILP